MSEKATLIIKKVSQLNADGSETDITDNPELWFPKVPTKKEVLKLRMWKIINDKLNFYSAEKQITP